MILFHLVVNSESVLDTFSPVELVAEIMKRCKDHGEIPVDIWTTEVK